MKTSDFIFQKSRTTGKEFRDFEWVDKLDIYTGEVVSWYKNREGYDKSALPTAAQLKESGELEEVDLMTIGDIRLPKISLEEMAEAAAKEAKDRFGIEIPKEAFQHNIDAWNQDLKSGYLAGDYFVFTPCKCNTLHFVISKNVGLDWQKTYMA